MRGSTGVPGDREPAARVSVGRFLSLDETVRELSRARRAVADVAHEELGGLREARVLLKARSAHEMADAVGAVVEAVEAWGRASDALLAHPDAAAEVGS